MNELLFLVSSFTGLLLGALIFVEVWRVLKDNRLLRLRQAAEKGDAELAGCIESGGRASVLEGPDSDTGTDCGEIIAAAVFREGKLAGLTTFLKNSIFVKATIILVAMAAIAGLTLIILGITGENTVAVLNGISLLLSALIVWRILYTLGRIHDQFEETIAILSDAMQRLGLGEDEARAAGWDSYRVIRMWMIFIGVFIVLWLVRYAILIFTDLDLSSPLGFSIFFGAYFLILSCLTFTMYRLNRDRLK